MPARAHLATRSCGQLIPRMGRASVAPVRHQVFLVPGFFGFTSLGDQNYFTDVAAQLDGPGWQVTSTDTDITASVRERTRTLARLVAEHLAEGVEAVHFVGHSTGGLDARTLLTPDSEALEGLRFADGSRWDPELSAGFHSHAARLQHTLAATRSVTGLSTPHGGSPLADLGLRLGVHKLLFALGNQLERPTLAALAAAGVGAFKSALELVPRAPSIFNRLRALQDGFLEVAPEELVAYIAELGLGTGIVHDLSTRHRATPEADIPDRAGVRYYCVITGTPEPTRGGVPQGEGLTALSDPLFRTLRGLTGRAPATGSWSPAMRTKIMAWKDRHPDPCFGSFPLVEVDQARRTMPNDGVVPSYAQVHGEVVAVLAADHLDAIGFYGHCIGQLDQPASQACGPEHRQASSWVISGSGYDNARHLALWRRVRAAMAAAES